MLPILGGINAAGITGIDATSVKEIQSGSVASLLGNSGQSTSGFWGALDNVGESLSSSLGTIINAYGQKIANDTYSGAEAAITTAGTPNEQALNGAGGAQSVGESFFEKNKTAVYIGAGVSALVVIALLVRK